MSLPVITDSTANPFICEGLLHYCHGARRTWRLRNWRLYRNGLLVNEIPDSGLFKAVVMLDENSSLLRKGFERRICNDVFPSEISENERFCLITGKGNYYFFANSATTCQQWQDCLKQVLEAIRGEELLYYQWPGDNSASSGMPFSEKEVQPVSNKFDQGDSPTDVRLQLSQERERNFLASLGHRIRQSLWCCN